MVIAACLTISFVNPLFGYGRCVHRWRTKTRDFVAIHLDVTHHGEAVLSQPTSGSNFRILAVT
jgi:hypothetical protein